MSTRKANSSTHFRHINSQVVPSLQPPEPISEEPIKEGGKFMLRSTVTQSMNLTVKTGSSSVLPGSIAMAVNNPACDDY